jgi:hypothetical protein
MRIAGFVITAAVVTGLSGTAMAQTSASAQTGATNPPVNQGVANTSSDDNRNWMVSGFLGTNFGSSRNNDNVELLNLENFDTGTTSANFGGQVAYLGRGVIGGEFLAEFSPSISTFNNVLFEHAPSVNTYMFNAIAVAPFGHAHSYDPYVSGGIGWVALHATIFTLDPTRVPNINTIGTESVSGSRFGWDLGGGVMAWSEKNWGFRGDLRYYRTTSNSTDVFDLNNIGNGDLFTRVELSGISFWKANAGVSFRW